MNHVEYLSYEGVRAMNSRVVALADYRGNTPTGVGGGSVLLGQATLV